MKVTKELEKKIDRLLAEKYDKLINPLVNEKNTLVSEFKNREFEKINKIVNDNPYFSRYINIVKYQRDTQESFIMDNMYRFVDFPEYTELDAKISSLENAKRIDKENLIIGISYEKNIDGIKEVFKSIDLEF